MATDFSLTCGICDIEHACHCSRMAAWCRHCLPPLDTAGANRIAAAVMGPQSRYAAEQGEAPVIVRVPLVGRMSA